jgi:flagellar biosynthesis protein
MYRRYRAASEYGGPRRKTASALRYDPDHDRAPVLIASGAGAVAEHILRLAEENGIPIYDDPALSEALATVNLNDEIPPEMYLVVAEVLAYIYRVSARRSESGRSGR